MVGLGRFSSWLGAFVQLYRVDRKRLLNQFIHSWTKRKCSRATGLAQDVVALSPSFRSSQTQVVRVVSCVVTVTRNVVMTVHVLNARCSKETGSVPTVVLQSLVCHSSHVTEATSNVETVSVSNTKPAHLCGFCHARSSIHLCASIEI